MILKMIGKIADLSIRKGYNLWFPKLFLFLTSAFVILQMYAIIEQT